MKAPAISNPDLSVMKFQNFKCAIANQFQRCALFFRPTMLFRGMALLLVTLGVYGVTTYGMARGQQRSGNSMVLGRARR